MRAVVDLSTHIGVTSACEAFALERGVLYRDRARHRRSTAGCVSPARPRPPLAFSGAEQDHLLGLLDSERFADMAPASIYATLLDEGLYHGSIRTMYRLLARHREVGERRRQRAHPVYAKPQLLATAPNVVWSWDISVPQQAA